jgi:hypothetical protein
MHAYLRLAKSKIEPFVTICLPALLRDSALEAKTMKSKNSVRRKRIVLSIALVSLSGVFLAPFSSLVGTDIRAQDHASSASLEETVQFLKGMMRDECSCDYKSRFIYHVSVEKFDGCSLGFKQFDTLDTKMNWIEYQMKLSDLEPLSVEVEEKKLFDDTPSAWIVNLKTTSRLKRIKTNVNYSDKDYYEDTAGIWVCKKESARRIAKAFEHAIKLCGGKADPF